MITFLLFINLLLKSHAMKSLKSVAVAVLCCFSAITWGQEKSSTPGFREYHGNALNAGIGLVYFGYVGQTVPAVNFNYEFDVARNFTLAPFITYFAYQEYVYWGDPAYPYRDYYYRESVMPVGVKGTYYFDQLLNANSRWDFYLGASLGVAIRKTVWENGYYGNRAVARGASRMYLDGYLGAEYHLTRKAGIFLDLSTGISTLGLAAHL